MRAARRGCPPWPAAAAAAAASAAAASIRSSTRRLRLPLPLRALSSQRPPPEPPHARRGDSADPYAWMEQESDEVLEHLNAENRHSDRAMASTRQLQDKLFREMRARVRVAEPEDEDEAQQRRLGEPGGDGYVYYTRRPRGQNFPIYCRQPCDKEAGGGEEVLLDQNAWPEYHRRFHVLGDAKVSPRQGRIAFVLWEPEKGGKGWTLYVQELRSREWWTVEGKGKEDGWAGVGPSFEWGAMVGEEEEVLYFTKVDEHGRPHEAWAAFLPVAGERRQGLTRSLKRVLALDPVADKAFFLTATRTKDRRFVSLAATSKTSAQVWLLPGPTAAPVASDAAVTTPRLFCPRRQGVQYFVDHGEDAFFVVANAEPGGEYALYTLPTAAWEANNPQGAPASTWRPSVETNENEGSSSSIEDIDLFRGHCVLYTRAHTDGAPALRVFDRPGFGSSSHGPTLPPEAAAGKLQPGLNQDYESQSVRFSVTSPILPDVAYAYDMAARRLVELHREQLPGRPPLDPSRRYRCHRAQVPTDDDGTETIPLTLVYREDVQPGTGGQEGEGHPVLLLGYGAYGVCLPTGFRPELLPLLERGWVLAFAHVRGGGEKGRGWHAQGKGAHKLNSLLDYLRCADWLVSEGWTRPGRIAGHGGSAGALVVAGAAHRRPELFGSVVLKVPFLDLSRTMTDPALPLTVHEYDEWGDPGADPAVAARLAALSPYDTLPREAAAFPPTLLLASLADDRVKGWEAAKYAAKARGVRVEGRGGRQHPEVLLRMERDRGHEAPLTLAEMLQEAAFEQAFMLTRMGLAGEARPAEGESEGRVVARRSPGGGPKRRGGGMPPVPPLAFW